MVRFFLRNKNIIKKCCNIANCTKTPYDVLTYFPSHKIKPYIHMSASNIHMLSNPRLFGVVGFKLSDIGEGIAEVELIKWHKNVGDDIEEMENLCTVQSDKAAVEITSRYSGILKHLYYKEGDIIKIGSILVDVDTPEYIEEKNDEKIEEKIPEKIEETTKKNIIHHSSDNTAILASPACRRLAKELNVDLKQVKGTGKDGKITKEDIEKYALHSKADEENILSSKVISTFSSSTDDTIVEIKGYSRAMVKAMTESLKVPHLNIGEEYDITHLLNARNNLREKIEKEYGVKLTITSVLIKAISLCLKSIPILNSKIDPSGTKYTMFGSHNISVAIDSPNGLVVPNIKGVENLNIIDIQKQLLRLQHLAQSNSLSPEDLKGGTVSVSNVGVIAGTYIKPIIFDGQAMIVGIGRIRKLPRFDAEGNLCEKQIINFSYSADHRHCDGATVARFAALMKKYLENPELMLFLTR